MKKLQDMLQRDLITMVAGGLLGQVMGGMNDKRQDRMNAKNIERQKEASKELTDHNTEKQKEMWEHTGYVNQRRQMEEAGLNPALLYGKGGSGGQTAAVSQGSAGMGAAPSSGGEGMGMVQAALQARMQEAQVENLKADTKKKNVEADKTAGVDTEKTRGEIGQIEQNTELAKVEIELKKMENEFQKETYEDRADYIDSQAKKAIEEVNQAGNQTSISHATWRDAIIEIKARAIGAQIENALKNANIEYTKEQTQKIGAELALKEREIDIKEFEAEMKAAFPSIMNAGGNLLQQIFNRVDEIGGFDKGRRIPFKVEKK